MLHFILGGARSGKSEEVTRRIRTAARVEDARILLVVPEQFTFETEKALFGALGGEAFRRVNVTSFTRIASEVFRTYGGLAGTYAGDCAKLVLMDRAVAQVSDRLEIYQKSVKSKAFSSMLLDAVTELKNAGVTPEVLLQTSARLPEGNFRRKTEETAWIYGAYDALLASEYLDPLDDLSRALELVRPTAYLQGCTIFLDEFKGFTAVELGWIRYFLTHAQDVTLTLCLDRSRAEQGMSSPFSCLLDLYHRILRIARQENIPVEAPLTLSESWFSAPELSHLERNVFSPLIRACEPASPAQTAAAIQAVRCRHEYDEVDYVLSSIAALVQERGFRYRDIAVLTRDLETYLPLLEAAFPRYRIPYYSDREMPVTGFPLIRLVRNVLQCLTDGFSSEHILSWLKCGLSPFSLEEVAEFENYIFVWDISAGQWNDPFTGHPQGFQEEMSDEAQEALERINHLRAYVCACLGSLREAVRGESGLGICSALWEFLEQAGVRNALEARMAELYAREEWEEAALLSRIWDTLAAILDEIADASGKVPVSMEQFSAYFLQAAQVHGLGRLPQSLDCVTVGQADRIRVSQKRAVFILGVNENVFPYVPTGGGVFTDREREQLLQLDIDIARPLKDQMREERFVAYKALCLPSEHLILTARTADIAGTVMAPSILFGELQRMFGPAVIRDTQDIPREYFCRSGETAFSCLAGRYLDDTPLTAALRQLLPEYGYAQRLQGLSRVLEKRTFSIRNRSNAAALFGTRMRISPTRVESFYHCRFRYFMEQGIRAFPLRRAELDPLETGTLIHQILFTVTSQVDLKQDYDRSVMRRLVQTELDRYIASVMGGVRNKTNRFLYLYNRVCLSVLKIIEQLHEELAQSRFEPIGYEVEIRDGAEITPLRLMGEDETEIIVFGKVDRIDAYTNAKGEKFIRIIDYKSGRKTFNLNDVLYGLNLQMLIYLQCILQNGSGAYANALPAGILYMPAADAAPSLPRNASEDDIRRQKRKNYAMNGLILADADVIQAMDASMEGIFIPVSTNRDGNFSKASQESLVTLQELGKINSYIDRLVIQMAQELHGGNIEAFPVEGSCEYCDYRGVCGITRASAVEQYVKHDREEIYAMISQQEGEESNG